MQTPPEPETLTESQADRRRRVIEAAIALASDGGYEAVQMRDIASSADVALGTIYRYFTSKDHLLAAAWTEWSNDQQKRGLQRPPQGRTKAERVIDILRRGTRALERRPQLAAAFIASMSSTDNATARELHEVSDVMTRMLAPALDSIDPLEQSQITQILGLVWIATLQGWINGRIPISQVYSNLEMAAHLILDPREGRRD